MLLFIFDDPTEQGPAAKPIPSPATVFTVGAVELSPVCYPDLCPHGAALTDKMFQIDQSPLDEFSVEVGTDDSLVFGFGSEPYTYLFLANADVIRATLQPLLDYSFMKRDPSRVRSLSDGRRFLPPILKDTQPNQ